MHKQASVSLILTEKFFKLTAPHNLVTPGIWAGINPHSGVANVTKSAADRLIRRRQEDRIAYLVGRLSLKYRLLLPVTFRVLIKAFLLMDIQSAKNGSHVAPAAAQRRQPAFFTVQNLHFDTGGVGAEICRVPGSQFHRFRPVCKQF